MSDEKKIAIEGRHYAILAVAHAAQDAQYGFGYIENQIPLQVRALGDPRTPPQPPLDARP